MKGWKSREWKQSREWKLLHQKAGVENAGETSMESQNSRSLTLRRVEHWISLPKWVTTAMWFRFVVYWVNLLWLTFTAPKKSPLLSPPLCSSNVRVTFFVSCQTLHSKSTRCTKQASSITRFSVNIVRNTFLKLSLSTLFLLPWCRDFHSRVFHSRDFSVSVGHSTNWTERHQFSPLRQRFT